MTVIKQILFGLLLLTSACSSCQPQAVDPEANAAIDPEKVLIVYLSRTNNAKAIAQIIHENVGGKLVALELPFN